jgi:hypothetical protein
MNEARKVTPQEIREYRERTGASMMDAKRFLQSYYDLEFLEVLRTYPIEDKVNWLIDQKLKETLKICKAASGPALLTFP